MKEQRTRAVRRGQASRRTGRPGRTRFSGPAAATDVPRESVSPVVMAHRAALAHARVARRVRVLGHPGGASHRTRARLSMSGSGPTELGRLSRSATAPRSSPRRPTNSGPRPVALIELHLWAGCSASCRGGVVTDRGVALTVGPVETEASTSRSRSSGRSVTKTASSPHRRPDENKDMYSLRAVIAAEDVLRDLAGAFEDARVVPLGQGLVWGAGKSFWVLST